MDQDGIFSPTSVANNFCPFHFYFHFCLLVTMSCPDWEEFCLQQIFTFTSDVLFTTTFTFIDIVNLQEPFFLDRAVICCEQEGEVAAAARDQLDYFEIQEFGSKDSFVFKVVWENRNLIVFTFCSPWLAPRRRRARWQEHGSVPCSTTASASGGGGGGGEAYPTSWSTRGWLEGHHGRHHHGGHGGGLNITIFVDQDLVGRAPQLEVIARPLVVVVTI